jgi:hypothetical protein
MNWNRLGWFRPIAVVAFLASFLLMPRASAHQVGVSRGQYTVTGDGLDATIALSRRDLIGAIQGIDQNRDGALSTQELDAKREDVQTLFVEKLVVKRGNEACRGTLASSHLDEPDGVEVKIHFACPEGGTALSIDFDFVDPLGAGHRHLARITGGAGPAIDGVYYRGKSHADIELPPEARAKFSNGYVVHAIRRIATAFDLFCFLFGLVLVVRETRSTAFIAIAFTLGLGVALILAKCASFTPTARVLGPAAAVSVLYVGADNLASKSGRGRVALAFPFGLVFGFGFAQAFSPPAERSALVSGLFQFNVGLDVAVAVVFVVAALIARALQRHRWFERRTLPGLSTIIAVLGLFWFVTRLVSPPT